MPFNAAPTGEAEAPHDAAVLEDGRKRLADGDATGALLAALGVSADSPLHVSAGVLAEEAVSALLAHGEREAAAVATPLPPPEAPPADIVGSMIVPSLEQCLAWLSACLQGKRWPEVEALLALGAAHWPDAPGLIYADAQRLRLRGELDHAATAYRRYLGLLPDAPNAWANLGVCHFRQGRTAEAMANFERAVTIDPGHLFSWRALADCLDRLAEHCLAERVLWHAYRVDPSSIDTIKQLAALLFRIDFFDTPQRERWRALCAHVLAGAPLQADVLSDVAAVSVKMKLYEHACALAIRSIELEPASSNNAYASLLPAAMALGDLENGWYAIDRIWADRRATDLRLDGPAWAGEPLHGKTLLVYTNAGFGDTLQFCRFLDHVKAGRVMLVCQDDLLDLLRANFPDVDVMGASQWLAMPQHYDYQTRAMSLPCIMRLHDMQQLVWNRRLGVDEAACQAWAERLATEKRYKVGFAWQGSAGYPRDHYRSLALSKLKGLSEIEHVACYSLQKSPEALAQIEAIGAESWLCNQHALLTDFTQTAAFMKQLDLVISIDTSMTHLAGNLGCKSWLLLDEDTCWRWFDRSDSTVWYPNTTIFKQTTLGDWTPVLDEVARRLEALAREKRALQDQSAS